MPATEFWYLVNWYKKTPKNNNKVFKKSHIKVQYVFIRWLNKMSIQNKLYQF